MRVLPVLTLFVIACGEDITHQYRTENTYQTYEQPKSEEPARQLFSGYFYLDGESTANCIYLDEKISGVVDIESDCQSLITINPEDKSLGNFPTLSQSGLLVVADQIRFSKNINYKSKDNVKEDISGDEVDEFIEQILKLSL